MYIGFLGNIDELPYLVSNLEESEIKILPYLHSARALVTGAYKMHLHAHMYIGYPDILPSIYFSRRMG